MTIVLLHGVPETADIWDDVRVHLDAPSVALRLPGFGCPRPEGFTATKDAYVDWVLNELKSIDGPIDIVGHDWGGGFTARIGTKYPEAVRSWTTDVAGVIHPDYVWHDFAQIWQTPGDGEKFFEDQNAATPEDRAPLMQMFGLDEKAALKLAAMADPVMGTCILDLYRSATPNPHKDWSDGYEKSAKPCMVFTLHRGSVHRRYRTEQRSRRRVRRKRSPLRDRPLLAAAITRRGRGLPQRVRRFSVGMLRVLTLNIWNVMGDWRARRADIVAWIDHLSRTSSACKR